jgi:metallo-beta-lactamase family protein
MINVQVFTCNMLQENCFIISDETKECAIIDCGAFYQEERDMIFDYIKKNQLKPKHLLATHGHLDHNFGNSYMQKEFGLNPKVHHKDKFLMESIKQQAQLLLGLDLTEEQPKDIDYLTKDDIIEFGNQRFTIIETPGHTPGSVFFYNEKEHIAFSGDTIFKRSIGRTDLEGGSMFQMIQTLRFVSQLPDKTILYPGHGESTTIGDELNSNPYIDR